MKTILFLLGRYPGYGGIENVTTLLANHFCEHYHVTICSHWQQAEDELLQKLSSDAKFYRMPDKGLKVSESNILFFEELVKKENVDIILNQDSYFPNEYLLDRAKKCKDLKIIEIEHSSPNGFVIAFWAWARKFSDKWNLYKILKEVKAYWSSKKNEVRRSQLIYNLCDRYVMLSEGLIPIRQHVGKIEYRSKFMAIGNPLVLDTSKIDLTKKEKRCLFVGRLDWMKGLDRLMRIWTNVEASVPEWRLSIVGDGPEMPTVKKSIKKYHLQRVDIEGFQSDVYSYYNKAQVLCMCSTFEGFPLVLPEAMAFGVVPVVFDSFPALHDILKQDVEAIVVPAFDEEKYILSLISILQDDNKRSTMSLCCMESKKRFGIDRVMTMWNSLITELTLEHE